MDWTKVISDSYERKARLYPALLLIAPAVATIVVLASSRFSLLQSIASGIVAFGGAFLLTQLARDSGKKAERTLFESWGGIPSITIFRHRDKTLDSITKTRYHSRLAKLVVGTKAPTPDKEAADVAQVDKIYEAWSHYIRINTRDTKKYPLLFQENINYGYRRNVWGLRPFGIGLSALCVAVVGTYLYFIYSTGAQIHEEAAATLALSLLFLALWTFRFTASWVRVPAEAYACRLAEAVDSLGTTASPSSSTRKQMPREKKSRGRS